MSDESSDPYWDSVTAYYPPEDRIESVARWRTPELDLHGCYLRAIPDQVWDMTYLKELHLYQRIAGEYRPADRPDLAESRGQ
jgi:hypothetical protein